MEHDPGEEPAVCETRAGPLDPSGPPQASDHPFYRPPPHLAGKPSGVPEAANAGRYR